MDELIKLLGLVADDKKEDAQKLFDAVKTTISGLDGEINKHQGIANDAILTRDTIKTQLKSIATSLGVESDNVAEAIATIKASKGGKGDEVQEKEIEQLKNEITELTNKLDETTTSSKTQLLKMSLKTDIAKALPAHNAKVAGYDYITKEIESKAVYEEGKPVFKNEDGTTLRIAGKDATVDDIVKQMFEKEQKENESMFFNIQVQDSGAGGGAGGTQTGDFMP